MRQLWRSLATAFSMYSSIPVPRVEWREENMRYVMCFFPLVGVVTGAAIWCWLWLCRQFGVGAPLAAVVCTALPVLVSGGIHLDGFCDTVDALASHASRERKLEILRDPHTGAFAVMGCCLYLLILFGLWMQHVFSPRATAALCIGFVQSRVLSGLSVVTFPCAKTSGLAAQFANAAHRARVRTVLITFAALCAAAMVACAPVAGAACCAAAALVFIWYRSMSLRQFGGITGDLAGWFLQLCELAMLVAAVLVQILRI